MSTSRKAFSFYVVGGGAGDGEPCLVGASVRGGEMARITAIIKTEANLASAWLSQCQGQKINAELLAWFRVWLSRHTCYAPCAHPV